MSKDPIDLLSQAEHARNEEKAFKLRVAREGQAAADTSPPHSKQGPLKFSSPVARKTLCPEFVPEAAVSAPRRRVSPVHPCPT